MAPSRNQPCPCGSGKKYKRCCMASGRYEATAPTATPEPAAQLELAKSAFNLKDDQRAWRALQPLLSSAQPPHGALGLACRLKLRAREFDAACDYGLQALEQQPHNAATAYNLGNACALAGRQEDALRYFRRALELKPGMIEAYANMANTLRDMGRSEEAMGYYVKLFDSDRLNLSTKSQALLSLHLYVTDQHEEMFRLHRQLGATMTALAPVDTPRREARAGRSKIRLGYLSPRFSREIVGYFFLPIFRHHDREAFELYLYSATPRADDVTDYLRENADAWTDVGALSDAELCRKIVDDEVDILIDLAGHAPESRITAVARKPAPVQVSMLDYFDTTGVAALDYYVSDHYSTPPGSPQRFSEELLYLDRPRLVYAPPDYAPEVSVRSSEGPIVFGSFNRHQKIVPQVMDAWSALLVAVPDARLLLKGKPFTGADVQSHFISGFTERGVDPARIEFRGASPHADMLGEYADIDIALDTFPYNGGLTTCEALWMGTPVITLLGERLISRQTAGMLAAVGLDEFVAETIDQFVAIGERWAQQRDELNALRLALRQRMSASPLVDGAGYTRELEEKLRAIWQLALHSGEELERHGDKIE